MAMRAALTELRTEKAQATDKPIKLSDGGGMFLLIHTNGSKYWRLAYSFAGKRKLISLGVYPDVSLAEARAARDDARTLLANGIDPSAAKRAQKAEQQARLAQINPVFQLTMKDDALTIRTKRATLALTTEQTAAVRMFLIATPNEVSYEQID